MSTPTPRLVSLFISPNLDSRLRAGAQDQQMSRDEWMVVLLEDAVARVEQQAGGDLRTHKMRATSADLAAVGLPSR